MEYRIATISGDGIGPEIVREAKKVLDATDDGAETLHHFTVIFFHNIISAETKYSEEQFKN